MGVDALHARGQPRCQLELEEGLAVRGDLANALAMARAVSRLQSRAKRTSKTRIHYVQLQKWTSSYENSLLTEVLPSWFFLRTCAAQ